MRDTNTKLSDDDLRELVDMAREDVEVAKGMMSDAAKRFQEAQTMLRAFEAFQRLRRKELVDGR